MDQRLGERSSSPQRESRGRADGFLPVEIVERFEIGFRRYIGADGTTARELPAFASDRETMLALFEGMIRTRVFDAKAVAMQRTGQIGTFASSFGQEAVEIGLASAMREEDVLLPTYREHGALLWRGVTMVELLQYWGGDERGSNWAGPRQDFPIAVPVGTQVLHAVGVAKAIAIRHEPRVAVGVLGDGGTSKGDFYEAMNFAGVWRLPAVFIVNNNQWAISMPRREQSAAATLAQKAIAAGIFGEQVDGNDVVAVRQAVEEALARGRSGDGPSLIEAVTYRLSDHSTADDASRYRSAEEVEAHRKQEPFIRLRAFLKAKGWLADEEEQLTARFKAEADAVQQAFMAISPEPRSAMFDHLFERLPEVMRAQRSALDEEAPDD